jgi:hypothetical protein
VDGVKVLKGAKSTFYVVTIGGQEYTTFDKKVADLAGELALRNLPCRFTFVTEGKYKNIKTLEAAE